MLGPVADSAEPEGESEDPKAGATKPSTKTPRRSGAKASTRSGSVSTDKPKEQTQSVDRLVDAGCTAVEKHRPSSGVEPLRQAIERSPRNLDALVCLASAYAAMSNLQRAQTYFKRALSQSPRHRTALAGAGRVAERMGLIDDALRYYRRLLTIDASHAAARKFVDAHGGRKNRSGAGKGSGDESAVEKKPATGDTAPPAEEEGASAGDGSGSPPPTEGKPAVTPKSVVPPPPDGSGR